MCTTQLDDIVLFVGHGTISGFVGRYSVIYSMLNQQFLSEKTWGAVQSAALRLLAGFF